MIKSIDRWYTWHYLEKTCPTDRDGFNWKNLVLLGKGAVEQLCKVKLSLIP